MLAVVHKKAKRERFVGNNMKSASHQRGRSTRMTVRFSSGEFAKALLVLAAILGLSPANAQTLATSPTLTGQSAPGEKLSPFSYEISSDAAFIGRGSVDLGGKTVGVFKEITSSASFVMSDQISNSFILRLGLNWDRFAFDTSNQLTPLPASLDALAAVVGSDIQLTSALLVRIEASPGIYGSFNEVSGRDFDVPVRIGASYFHSADLIYTAGLSIDMNANWPVIPAVGVYWKLSDQWIINGVAPRPQIRYVLSDKVTLFVGADLQTDVFRVDDQFGSSRGIPKLNHALMDFWEVRGGAGFSWAMSDSVKLELEGGTVPYRRFDFYRADFKMSSSSWSPYIRLGLAVSF